MKILTPLLLSVLIIASCGRSPRPTGYEADKTAAESAAGAVTITREQALDLARQYAAEKGYKIPAEWQFKDARSSTLEGISVWEVGFDLAPAGGGTHAFAHCTGITSVKIPNSVATVWDGAFSDCGSLSSITLDADHPYLSYRNHRDKR